MAQNPQHRPSPRSFLDALQRNLSDPNFSRQDRPGYAGASVRDPGIYLGEGWNNPYDEARRAETMARATAADVSDRAAPERQVRQQMGRLLQREGGTITPTNRKQLLGMLTEIGKPPTPDQLLNDPGIEQENALARIRATGAESRKTAGVKLEGRGALSSDANRIAELDTSLDDLAVLRQTVAAPGEPGATGAMAKLGAMAPNVVTEYTGFGADAKSKQATIDRVKQVIGKALEGGVLRKEDEYKYEKILPTIGDPDNVVLSKLDGLESAITQRRERTLDALDSAGFNMQGFSGGRRTTTQQGQAPQAGEIRMIEGERAEWDGRQWVAVE